MEFVCPDAGGTEWRFNSATKCYERHKNGQKIIKIYGEFLPDPEILLKKRIDIHAKKGERVNLDALKPSPAVYSLWDHWKTVNNT